MKAIDITGQKYGRLTAVKRVSVPNNNIWLFKCDCGNEITISRFDAASGNTQSCGCLKRDLLKINKSTHKMSKSKEYRCWAAMKGRCLSESNAAYPEYGGGGISLCDEFLSFENFIAHIGPIPDKSKRYSIDRIDNTRGYELGNVRWAIPAQQTRNTGASCTSKTGVVGVFFSARKGQLRCTGCYSDINGKKISREFSVRKYGMDKAFELACKFRLEGLQSLIGTDLAYGSEKINNIERALNEKCKTE